MDEAPARIEVEERARLRLEWADGLQGEVTAGQLRASCACADCRTASEREGRRRLAVLGDSPPTIDDASLVGAYGIRFTFGPDGHRTGIFTWRQLRAIAEGQPAQSESDWQRGHQ